MPRHAVMWWVAGGATLLGASMVYLATRPAVAPVVTRAQSGWARLKRQVPPGAFRGTFQGLFKKGRCGSRRAGEAYARNAAFEAYRTVELARLEDEERAFRDYLERLRMARDRQEFEAFMAERRDR